MSWISPDSQDMLEATAALAEQLEVSAAMALEVPGLPSPEGLDSIVVLGMGGSGVAGEILQAVGKSRLRLPVVLSGDYSPAVVCRSGHTRVRRLFLRADRRDPRGGRGRPKARWADDRGH